MNKAEADNQVLQLRKGRGFVFCPVINGMCRTDCECYKQLKTKRIYPSEDYYISGGYCTNYSLVGPELLP